MDSFSLNLFRSLHHELARERSGGGSIALFGKAAFEFLLLAFVAGNGNKIQINAYPVSEVEKRRSTGKDELSPGAFGYVRKYPNVLSLEIRAGFTEAMKLQHIIP
jgi:hypothetical protein